MKTNASISALTLTASALLALPSAVHAAPKAKTPPATPIVVTAAECTSDRLGAAVSPDAIGEFKVQTNSFSAEFGRSAGAVVNVSSVSGVKPAPMIAMYGASKAMMISLTEALAVELGPGVRVNAVAPGAVYTPLHRETPKEVMESLSPMGRPSTVKDITDAVMYLTDAATVTGHILYVDGGAHFGRW